MGFQLVYASVAPQTFSEGELLEMLVHYREKNLRLGVTGMLLYKERAFMQALEGKEATVRALYVMIQADPRHEHVHTLAAIHIDERHFPAWSMGFKHLGDEWVSDALGGRLLPRLPAHEQEISWQGSVALSLLATFAQER